MAKVTLECVEFKPQRKGTMVGIATIRIAELRLAFNDVYLHVKNGKGWAQLPSRPWVQADKTVKIGEDGKPVYFPLFKFDNDTIRHAFSDRVVQVVQEKYPNAFDEG